MNNNNNTVNILHQQNAAANLSKKMLSSPHLGQVCKKCNALNRLSKAHLVRQNSVDTLII